MVIEAFPPVELADERGLLAIGGDLEVESLLLAYRSGIFPWPTSERQLAWFSPPKRAVLWLKDFHVSKSLQKEIKRARFSVTYDGAFAEVITGCSVSENRTGQGGTWITPSMIRAYLNLHKAGYAHSIEAWQDSELAGGLYGVSIGGFFAGESMFYIRSNASKVAFYHLIMHLKANGIEWIDCQVMTPLLRTLGAKEVARERFLEMLRANLVAPSVTFSKK